MNKIKKLLFYVIICCFHMYGYEFISIDNDLKLTETQIIEYEKQGLSGDSLKCSILHDYYAIYLDKIDEGLYWLMVGAENGSIPLEYSYGYYLNNYSDKFRAIFFLKKSSEQGNESAKGLLSKNDETLYNLAKQFSIDYINDDNLDLFIKNAKLGNKNAALKLAQFYKTKSKKSVVESIERVNDESSYIYWLRLGLQNGSEDCLIEYVNLLLQSTDINDNIRANFWKEKISKSNGNNEIKESLLSPHK